ncbi:MAG: hypothetical protein AAGF12_22780 [Myxococcota bacterium]
MPTPGIVSSPFGVKGLLYRGTKSFFEAEGNWEALLGTLRPELRAFLSQRFLPGAFYEALVVPELIQVEASVCGKSVAAYLKQRTDWQARQDLHGVYRVVVRFAPPDMTVSRVVMVMTQMFNFGAPVIRARGKGHLDVDIGGIPHQLADWLHQCVGLYGSICLEMAGTTDANIRTKPLQSDGEVLGFRTVRLGFECRWK